MKVDCTYRERFSSFLKSRNIPEEYYKLLVCNAYHFTFSEAEEWIETQLLDPEKRDDIIIRSFSFDYTPEGLCFWNVIDKEWKEDKDFLTILTPVHERVYKAFCSFLKRVNSYSQYVELLAEYEHMSLLRYVHSLYTIRDVENLIWKVIPTAADKQSVWSTIDSLWREHCLEVNVLY